jgi:protein-S-isoprenylcysteine O-methyltransferase Ste14
MQEDSGWLKRLAGFVTKGLRLRTRAFIPFALLLLWLAAREPLNYWGFALAGAGELLRLWASGHLHKGAECLSTSGPYAFCRNPLYLGSMFLGIGLALAVKPYWLAAAVAVLFIIFHFITIAYEESRLEIRYAEEFAEYRRHVPRLIPRPWPWKGAKPVRFDFGRLLANREHWRALAFIIFAWAMTALSLLRPLQ